MSEVTITTYEGDSISQESVGVSVTAYEGGPGPQGEPGTDGVDGKSAYELAVEAGFVGTEAAWLDSLQGADGQDGLPGTTTWAGITDKPTIPDSADDIGAETPAGAQAKADAAEAAANAYTDTALTGVGGGAVDSVNGQTGAVVLGAADVSARPDTYVPTWAEVTGKPAIPDSADDVGADPAGAAAAAQAAAISAAASDATTKANTAEANAKAASTPIAHATNTTNPHAVTKAQVGLGSVDNVSAASLRDRSTHTGTQAATTITGLATVATSGAYADLSGKPSGGGGAVFVRTILSSSFTTTSASAVPVTGLSFTITPPSNGVLTLSGRANFQNSLASNNLYVGSVISPAPSAGSAQKWHTAPQPVANSWLTIPLSGSWQVVGGTAYTVQVSVQKSAGGTLTVDSNADYTELTGVFVPA